MGQQWTKRNVNRGLEATARAGHGAMTGEAAPRVAVTAAADGATGADRDGAMTTEDGEGPVGGNELRPAAPFPARKPRENTGRTNTNCHNTGYCGKGVRVGGSGRTRGLSVITVAESPTYVPFRSRAGSMVILRGGGK